MSRHDSISVARADATHSWPGQPTKEKPMKSQIFAVVIYTTVIAAIGGGLASTAIDVADAFERDREVHQRLDGDAFR